MSGGMAENIYTDIDFWLPHSTNSSFVHMNVCIKSEEIPSRCYKDSCSQGENPYFNLIIHETCQICYVSITEISRLQVDVYIDGWTDSP